MANPRAFISFDFDNNAGNKLYFVGQISNSRTPFNVEDWSSKTPLPEAEWESILEAKIKRCNMVIVLVGRHMASASGVRKEIAFANTHNIPVFGVYVDNADASSILPSGLPRNKVIPWNWEKIAAMIDQSMLEGKNRP